VARTIPPDISDDASIASAAEALEDEPIDLLINNAAWAAEAAPRLTS
jgi:NAD(P)-dependent dehydrogenase (short-subunit alcohol dehydrogenase family)